MSDRILTPEKYLSPQEIIRFRRALQVEQEYARARCIRTPVRDAAVFSTILGAGLRVSELVSLKVGHLYLSQGRCEILVEKSKGGKTRMVKIDKSLKSILKGFLSWKVKNSEITDPGANLFLSRNKKPYSTRAVQKRFHFYKDKAGVKKDCGVHALRHSFALLLYKASNYNLRLVQKQLGHSSIITTQIYVDVLDIETEKAVNKMFEEVRA